MTDPLTDPNPFIELLCGTSFAESPTLWMWLQAHPFFVPFVLCYLFAALQTWRLVFLLDPRGDCPLTAALKRRDRSVRWVFLMFAVAWPLFLLAAYWRAGQPEPTT